MKCQHLGSINLIEYLKEFGGMYHFLAVQYTVSLNRCLAKRQIRSIPSVNMGQANTVELIVHVSLQHGMKYVLRYPNVFGLRRDHSRRPVLAIFTGKMMAGEPVVIYGDGNQTRDFVYVSDCARANYLAVTVDHQPGIYNLGWGLPTSVNDIFSTLARVTDYGMSVQYLPAKVGETRHIYLNASKAKRDLGWSATISLEDGLRRTVEYFKVAEQVA
jgi:UDP-glucose 4-epimerase